MALSYKKDLGKYKDIDEDELLNNLSAEELKQLETALEEMDPEVRTGGLEEFQGSLVGGRSYGKGIYWKNVQFETTNTLHHMHLWRLVRSYLHLYFIFSNITPL